MIPILDWTENTTAPAQFAAQLGKACRETGFFVIRNHPLPDALVSQMFDQATAFFALPDADKKPLSISSNPHNRGWAAQGSESLDENSGQVDRKEAFNIGLDLAPDDPRVQAEEMFRGVNVWPELPGFRETALHYYTQVLDFAVALHAVLARDLNLPLDYFTPHFSDPMAILRLLSYPAASGTAGEIGAGAHTDYGSITLLMTDGAPGLQTRPRGGDWIDVPHIDGGFVVNIGDCLMRWSNDIYVSTPHRVLPPPRPRQSIAFFVDPNPESRIEALPGTGAPLYPPVKAADYLRSRLDATYSPETPE